MTRTMTISWRLNLLCGLLLLLQLSSSPELQLFYIARLGDKPTPIPISYRRCPSLEHDELTSYFENLHQ